MDHLWTPWRFHYIRSAKQEADCIFCLLPSEQKDRDNFIVARRRHTYIVLNKFPYTTGHLMIVTHRHVASLSDASSSELNEIIALSRDCESILKKVYDADGFNIGFNIGKSAGAGVAGHLHLHVVPRWEGDANLVSVIGQTRVIPEDLETSYLKLLPHFRHNEKD